MSRDEMKEQYGQTWDTDELQRDYTVEGFAYGFVVVRRKLDGQRGSLSFQPMPRVYHSFLTSLA